MADLALVWKDLSSDCAIQGADLARDDGITTAVILSLFLDARARPDDVIPDGTTNRRGWWADSVLTDANGRQDNHGSRLWLLHREKQMPEVLRRAKDYAQEALQWMITDGVASKVTVNATNPRMGWLVLDIEITLKNGETYPYSFTREVQNAL